MRGKLLLLVLVLVGAYYFFVLHPPAAPAAKPAPVQAPVQPPVQPPIQGQPQAPVPSTPSTQPKPAANPTPLAAAVSCGQQLANLKRFAADNASCQTADDCMPVQVAVTKGENDCQVLVDAVMNIDQVDAFNGKADDFFGAGCGDSVGYCPVAQSAISDARCVNNRCAWAPISS